MINLDQKQGSEQFFSLIENARNAHASTQETLARVEQSKQKTQGVLQDASSNVYNGYSGSHQCKPDS